MKNSAIVMLALLAVCAALCAQGAHALRWPKLSPSPWPQPQPLTPEEKGKCMSARNYTTAEKPCLDEIVSSYRNGKNLTEALTGKACCSFYWGVENTCYVHVPNVYFLHPKLLEDHCPKP